MKMQAITGKAMWYFPVFLDYGKRILLHSIGDHFVSAIATSDLLHTIGFDVFRVLLCVISDCSENHSALCGLCNLGGAGAGTYKRLRRDHFQRTVYCREGWILEPNYCWNHKLKPCGCWTLNGRGNSAWNLLHVGPEIWWATLQMKHISIWLAVDLPLPPHPPSSECTLKGDRRPSIKGRLWYL